METQGACLAKWQGVKYTLTPAEAASYVDREVLQSVGQHEAHLHSDQTNDIEKGCFRILFTDFKKPFFPPLGLFFVLFPHTSATLNAKTVQPFYALECNIHVFKFVFFFFFLYGV